MHSKLMSTSNRTLVSLWVCCAYFFHSIVSGLGSVGDSSPGYRECFSACSRTGCIEKRCIPQCINGDPQNKNLSGEYSLLEIPYEFEFLRWDCERECGYQCMNLHEAFRSSNGLPPAQYHGKWPFLRVFGLQEPASVIFSVINFSVTAVSLLRYLHLVYWKIPRRSNANNVPAYDYTQLWIIYGLLSLNAWFWSAVFHSKDTKFTEALDYSSAIAYLGYSFILAIIRCCKLRLEAPRVMISAPVVAFTATHIMYLNFYQFDYGWNMKVCLGMGSLQLLIWLVWSIINPHPAKFNVIFAVIATVAALALEVFDFPPLFRWFDAHSIWHLSTIPLTILWWGFVYEDARFCFRSGNKSKDETKKVE